MVSVQTSNFVPETVQSLLRLARERVSGILEARLPDLTASFVIDQGRVRDLVLSDQGTLEVVFSEILEPAVYQKARITAVRMACTAGEAVLQQGLIDENDAVEAVLAFVGSSFASVVTLTGDAVKFTAGAPDESSFSDLGANYEIYLPLEELVLNALAEHDAWDFVVHNFPIVRDVYYATPNAVQFFHQQSDYPTEVAVLQVLDGQKDVEEAIAESGLESFTALRAIQSLAENAYVELINPVQLFQLGCAAEEAGNWHRALHLYQRALERGLDDFDLQLKLAQALEKTGDRSGAVERYNNFVEKCAREFRLDDALKALKRVIALDPDTIAARQRHIELLRKSDRVDDATEEALRLAEMLHQKDRDQVAASILKEAIKHCPDDEALQKRFADLCKACGAQDEAQKADERVAKAQADRRDSGEALEEYQRRYVEGEDSLEVRSKLLELHLAQGNRGTALEHLDTLLGLGNPYGLRDRGTLRELHQKRYELRPGDRSSTWFLIDDALVRRDTEAAEKYLRGLITHLNPEEDRREILGALRRLVRIVPGDVEPLWQLAKELEKAGEISEAVATLRTVTELAAKNDDLEESTRALRESLRLAPFDPEGRAALIVTIEKGDDEEALRRERRHLFFLRIIEGDVDKAKELSREIAFDRSEDAFLLVLLADLCNTKGDHQMAGEQYARAGKLLVGERNFGLAGLCVEKLRELGTHPGLAEEITQTIEGAATPPAPSPAPSKDDESGEVFTPMKQRVVKGSVASITARLKSVKMGKSPNATPADAPQSADKAPKKKGGGLSSAISKLKALGKGQPGGASAASNAAPQAGSEPPADDLPQLASDDEPSGPSEVPPPPPPPKRAKLGGAAARLRALKGGGQPSHAAQDDESTAQERQAEAEHVSS